MKYDAIVVGARCAGAATAMLLARTGARVLLVDRSAPGSDTLSTHALMRGAVLQLHRWGVLPAVEAAATPPVRLTTFSYSAEDVTIAIEPRYGVEALYAPRRAILDRILVEAAAASGVDVRFGLRVDDVARDRTGRVRGIVAMDAETQRIIEAGIVIGADGLYSTIARRVGAASMVEGAHSTGILYSYWKGLQVDGYHWRFQTRVCSGAIPTNAGATCVFVSVPAARFRATVAHDVETAYRSLIAQSSPFLAERVDAACLAEPVRGFGGHRGFIRRGTGPGWALVGDAGYFKDPLTAHGITDALRDAEFLARAVGEGRDEALAGYERTRQDLSRPMFELTDEIASLAWTDERVQALHKAFSSEMSREVRALAGLDASAEEARRASAAPLPS